MITMTAIGPQRGISADVSGERTIDAEATADGESVSVNLQASVEWECERAGLRRAIA